MELMRLFGPDTDADLKHVSMTGGSRERDVADFETRMQKT